MKKPESILLNNFINGKKAPKKPKLMTNYPEACFILTKESTTFSYVLK